MMTLRAARLNAQVYARWTGDFRRIDLRKQRRILKEIATVRERGRGITMSTKKKSTLKLRGTLPYRIVPDEDWFIAKCELLHVNGQGKTKASAVRHLKDAIAAFLRACVEMGTLQRVLKDCGFYTMRVGHEMVWGAGGRAGKIPTFDTVRFSATFSVPHQPESPRLSDKLPTANLPWIVAVPDTRQSPEAA
jgi:predicted RNase H-like HicB family nuclease